MCIVTATNQLDTGVKHGKTHMTGKDVSDELSK